MIRGIFSGLLLTIGFFAILGLAIYFGVESQSWGVFGVSLVIGIVLLVMLSKALNAVGRVNMDSWLSGVGDCQYKHAWDGTGIAVNPTSKEVHLASRFKGQVVNRTYPFSDVREWSYEIPGFQTTGKVVGGGLQGASHNIGAGIADTALMMDAREKTGLALLVRDIDYPRWFVKFETNKHTKENLFRWMEILRQHVNEN